MVSPLRNGQFYIRNFMLNMNIQIIIKNIHQFWAHYFI